MVSDFDRRALDLHTALRGKVSVEAKGGALGPAELALLYSPGVGAACQAVVSDPAAVWTLTGRGNRVAVVSDGSAVLGLGNIGPAAGLPVMEGKALLFRAFAGLDAFPLVVDTQDPDALVALVRALAPSFGGINLEDIAAPRCFEIEERLQALLDIPVFHDDQHGTAVAVLAALTGASRRFNRPLTGLRVVVNGAGAAGTAVSRLLLQAGLARVTVCDRQGILAPGLGQLNPAMEALAVLTNPEGRSGGLATALENADVFIGVSAAGALTPSLIGRMAPRPLIFALANPEPEIRPDLALAAGAQLVATGRSDFPHQINNLLVFPGLFRGALAVRARRVTLGMKLAAAEAVASLAGPGSADPQSIVPSVFHPDLAFRVAFAVARAAQADGVAGLNPDPADLQAQLRGVLPPREAA